jgi:hypothetical protein
MIARSTRIHLLVLFLVVIISSGLFIVLFPPSTEEPSAADEYPYTIVEVHPGGQAAADLLESQGFSPVLWRGSVTIPLSRVGSIEEAGLSGLTQRLETGDLRMTPYYAELTAAFDPPAGEGELLFVPGEPDAVAEALEGSGLTWYVHRDRNLPVYAGLILWAIISAAMLIVMDQRPWTAIVAVVLLPLYLIRNPMYLAILSVLFIVLRETAVALDLGYRNEINADDGRGGDSLRFPRGMGELVRFLLSRIRRDAPHRALWALFTLLFMSLLSMLPGFAPGLLALVAALELGLLVLAAQYRRLDFTRSQEHVLFVARPITPSWDKPARNERAVLISVIAVSLALPFVFQVNAAPFATQFISPRILYDGDSAALLDRVAGLLEARVPGERGVEEGGIGDGSPGDLGEIAAAEILIADYAYQNAFPYLSINNSRGAGRYQDRTVYLSRFNRVDGEIQAFEEAVFSLDEIWLSQLAEDLPPYSMLRLYSHRQRWYDVRPEPGVLVVPRIWNLVPEILALLVLAFPWLGRWQFAPLIWIISRLSKAEHNYPKRSIKGTDE